MQCGDTAQAGIQGRFCPRCESNERQRYEWKPDETPIKHRRRCYDCGWDSGWVAYDEWIVRRGSCLKRPPSRGEDLRALAGIASPSRLDALVWAVHDLMLTQSEVTVVVGTDRGKGLTGDLMGYDW